MTINNHIVQSQKQNILCAITEEKEDFSISETNELKSLNADCIMVLGAGIRDDETPTPMLKAVSYTHLDVYKRQVLLSCQKRCLCRYQR